MTARDVAAAVAAEQVARIAASPTDLPSALPPALYEVDAEILQRGNKEQAREMAAIAAAEAAHAHTMQAVCEDIERAVHRKEAKAAVEAEAQQRVAQEWMKEVGLLLSTLRLCLRSAGLLGNGSIHCVVSLYCTFASCSVLCVS